MDNRFSKIPARLFNYQNASAYFVTYFGDIYYGSLWECPGYEDGFFIVRNDKLHEAINLDHGQKTAAKFRDMGWEIKDHRIIKEAFVDGNFKNTQVKTIHFSGTQFNKMFVFGAAASTYCVIGEKGKEFLKAGYNPPTGFDIFDQRYDQFCNKYPGVVQSIPEFESKKRDIEGCLENEWLAFKDCYNPNVTARHTNIQFYLQELFQWLSNEVVSKTSRYNLYSLFCKKLQGQLSSSDERAILVSFNYDTILDHFVESFSAPFRSMNDYIDWHNRNIILFKPHGSCNWGWPFKKVKSQDRSKVVSALFEQKTEPWQIYYDLLGEINETVEAGSWGIEAMLHQNGSGRYSINKNLVEVISPKSNSLYFPSLLLPYRDKDEFVMPYQQQLALTNCFGQINELILIGWKGNEALFNRQLRKNSNTLKKITIVNPNPQEVIDHLTKAGLDLSRITVNTVKDFETFVLNDMDV